MLRCKEHCRPLADAMLFKQRTCAIFVEQTTTNFRELSTVSCRLAAWASLQQWISMNPAWSLICGKSAWGIKAQQEAAGLLTQHALASADSPGCHDRPLQGMGWQGVGGGGAIMPILLRECEQGLRIVGHCYVHGIMDGELFEEDRELDEFVIVWDSINMIPSIHIKDQGHCKGEARLCIIHYT